MAVNGSNDVVAVPSKQHPKQRKSFCRVTTILFVMTCAGLITSQRRMLGEDLFISIDSTASKSLIIDHPQNAYTKTMRPMTKARIDKLRGEDGPKYTVLVTGAAGFVGMHTCLELDRLGMTPIGYDNVNSYYSTELKEKRIEVLAEKQIQMVRGDVCDAELLKKTIEENKITRIIHLAAQAGVRYSLDHPFEYTRNNIDCFVTLLETAKSLELKETIIYASSSSVYGNNVKIPFSETDNVENPASLYAATKRSDELIAQTYFNLYKISSVSGKTAVSFGYVCVCAFSLHSRCIMT